MKYVGWIYEKERKGFNSVFVAQFNVNADGTPREIDGLKAPYVKEFRSAQEAVDFADEYLKREVKLSETLGSGLGWRICAS